MAIIHVDESTPGLPNAGRLSGTNGDLVGILDIALPLNGWAIEYTSGNARVYRPGTGNRFRLHVNDDSATSGDARAAVVRGCENASNATTLTNPFPTVSQVADASANWLKSTLASTAARAFDIWVGETFVILAINTNGSANVFDLNFFGDYAPSLSAHAYNTVCSTRGSNSYTLAVRFDGWPITSFSTLPSAPRLFGARDYGGTVNSTIMGVVPLGNNSSFGFMSGTAAPLSGVTTGIDTAKTMLTDFGASSGTPDSTKSQVVAGWLPNLLYPLHSGRGAINTRDEYTDTAAGMATGVIVSASNAAGASIAVVQESDDWSPPIG